MFTAAVSLYYEGIFAYLALYPERYNDVKQSRIILWLFFVICAHLCVCVSTVGVCFYMIFVHADSKMTWIYQNDDVLKNGTMCDIMFTGA